MSLISSGAIFTTDILNNISSLKRKQMDWFWKHKDKGHVINHGSYNRLPDVHKEKFVVTKEEPTHEYASHDEDGFLLRTILAAEVLSEINSGNDQMSELTESVMPIADPDPTTFQGFDGGSGGGSGAGGDFSSSSDSSSGSDYGSDSSSSDSGADSGGGGSSD